MAEPNLSHEILENGVVVIAIIGELDSHGTRVIESDFSSALSSRTARAIIDLSQVSFLTSSALAMFVSHAKMLNRSGGKLYMAGINDDVFQIFQQSGFDTVFPITATVEDALNLIG